MRYIENLWYKLMFNSKFQIQTFTYHGAVHSLVGAVASVGYNLDPRTKMSHTCSLFEYFNFLFLLYIYKSNGAHLQHEHGRLFLQ